MRTSKLPIQRSRAGAWLFPVALAIFAATAAFGVASILPRKYRSEATLYFPVQADSSGNLASLASSLARGGMGGLSGDKAGNVSLAFGALSSPLIASGPQTAIAVMDSNLCRQMVVERLGLTKRWELSRQKSLGRLEKTVSLGIDKNGLLALEAVDEDPKLARMIADAYVQVLGKLSKDLSLNISTKNRQFLEQRVTETRSQMQQIERSLLEATVSDPDVAELNAPAEAAKGIVELEARLNAARVALDSTTRQLDFTRDKAKTALKSGSDLPVTSELGKTQRERLATLEYEFEVAKQELGPDNPRFILLREQLATARTQLRREIERESRALDAGIQPEILRLSAEQAGLEAQVAGLTRSYNEVRGRLAAIPSRQMRRERLGYELRAIREQLLSYEMDLAKARIAEDRDAITFQVVDRPEVAEEPFAPRRLFTAALGGVAGLLVGIAILIVRSSRRPDPLDAALEREVAVV